MVMLHKSLTLMEGKWSCYGGGQFTGGRMIMLERQPERRTVTDGGQFKGHVRMVLQRWSV